MWREGVVTSHPDSFTLYFAPRAGVKFQSDKFNVFCSGHHYPWHSAFTLQIWAIFLRPDNYNPLPGDAISFEQEREKWADWPHRLPVSPLPAKSLLGHPVLQLNFGWTRSKAFPLNTCRHRRDSSPSDWYWLKCHHKFCQFLDWENNSKIGNLESMRHMRQIFQKQQQQVSRVPKFFTPCLPSQRYQVVWFHFISKIGLGLSR